MMNEYLGYIKSAILGSVLSNIYLGWTEAIWTGVTALAVGFLGAGGGALFRLIQNYLKKRYEQYKMKANAGN